MVTPECLTVRHSSITVANMAYYSLPSTVESCIKESCLIHTMKALWGSKGTAPLTPNLGHHMEKSGQLHAPATLPPGKAGWSHSLSGHFREEKNRMSLLGSETGILQPVA